LTKPSRENCEEKEGCDFWENEGMRSGFGERQECDRFLGRERSAIAFEEDEGMRSSFDGMRGCDRVLME
jgi:hypothetical protein